MALRWDRSAQVTASEASAWFGDVSLQLIAWWVRNGKLQSVGKRGRSPLYRWGDLVDVERQARLTRFSSRNEERVAERTLTAA